MLGFGSIGTKVNDGVFIPSIGYKLGTDENDKWVMIWPSQSIQRSRSCLGPFQRVAEKTLKRPELNGSGFKDYLTA